MNLAILLVATAASVAIAPAAQARAGDAQWAACVWRTDPQAASNWLGLKAPSWQDTFGSPAELLGLRLMAVCDPTPADIKKPNRLPNWKSMQQQLKRAQPKGVPAAAAVPAVKAQLCEYYAVKDPERALYLAETVRVEGDVTIKIHQTYFSQAGTSAVKVADYAGRAVSFQFGGAPGPGSAIRMPQDTLIASPSEGYATETVCREIAADGTLIDA